MIAAARESGYPAAMDEAAITDAGGGNWAARYERKFSAPPARLWAALTDGALLGQWLAPGAIELKLGGAVRLAFTSSPSVIDSSVTAIAPGALLEYRWIDKGNDLGSVRFELAADGAGSRLALTHTMPLAARRPSALAAWHLHLELLAAALGGAPSAWSNDRFQELRGVYAKRLG
jgi:uncharacterized protein YndB with AHSA1/START domain